MGKVRLFTTLPTMAIGDQRLAALDLRVLACVSLHDGMSLVKGKGAGCYASNLRLAAEVGCEYSSLSRSLRRLQGWGYLVMERRADDKRMTTYRVRFDPPDSWPDRKSIGPKQVGETDNNPEKVVGQDAENDAEVVGHRLSEIGQNQPKPDGHYIPLKGELDSVETEELNSSEEARLAARSSSKLDFADNPVGQMATLERALKAGKRVNCLAWYEYLSTLQDCDDNQLSNHAGRLADLVIEAMSPAEYQQWGRDHGWVDESGNWDGCHPRGEAA